MPGISKMVARRLRQKRGGQNDTGTRSVMMWDPVNDMWRQIPADKAHSAYIEHDEESEGTPRIENYYEYKGFIPERYAPTEARALLAEIRAGQKAEDTKLDVALGLVKPDPSSLVEEEPVDAELAAAKS